MTYGNPVGPRNPAGSSRFGTGENGGFKRGPEYGVVGAAAGSARSGDAVWELNASTNKEKSTKPIRMNRAAVETTNFISLILGYWVLRLVRL